MLSTDFVDIINSNYLGKFLMLVNGKYYRTIEAAKDHSYVEIIDQTYLPFEFKLKQLDSLDDIVESIEFMRVRGAPLIGVTAAYGLAIAMNEDYSDNSLGLSKTKLLKARPTAVNLEWAVSKVFNKLINTPKENRVEKAWELATTMANEDVAINKVIGEQGIDLIRKVNKEEINILTHCNAGWLATIDHGTALSPIYKAVSEGLNIHVWVDETRPRNQGLSLTAWELKQANIKHTVISDNTGGLLMQQGKVDCIFVGADRISMDGQVCNKIGTYLKAIAANVHEIPFYVAAPLSSVDRGFKGSNYNFEIECRSPDEVMKVKGRDKNGKIVEVELGNFAAYNPAFDLTPSKYITKIICEKGVFDPQDIGDHK
jgi:methylthioribose-1-phosphate isomerase